VTFEYTGDKPLLIDLSQATPDSALKPDGSPFKGFKEIRNAISVTEGRTIFNEVIGVSNGMPNQRFRLAQPKLLRNTLEINGDSARILFTAVAPSQTNNSTPWSIRTGSARRSHSVAGPTMIT
jgi:hypothetical protein